MALNYFVQGVVSYKLLQQFALFCMYILFVCRSFLFIRVVESSVSVVYIEDLT